MKHIKLFESMTEIEVEKICKKLDLNGNRWDIQKYILKWQKEYDIWRRDGSFNQDRFILMMQDAGDELPKLKFTK